MAYFNFPAKNAKQDQDDPVTSLVWLFSTEQERNQAANSAKSQTTDAQPGSHLTSPSCAILFSRLLPAMQLKNNVDINVTAMFDILLIARYHGLITETNQAQIIQEHMRPYINDFWGRNAFFVDFDVNRIKNKSTQWIISLWDKYKTFLENLAKQAQDQQYSVEVLTEIREQHYQKLEDLNYDLAMVTALQEAHSEIEKATAYLRQAEQMNNGVQHATDILHNRQKIFRSVLDHLESGNKMSVSRSIFDVDRRYGLNPVIALLKLLNKPIPQISVRATLSNQY